MSTCRCRYPPFHCRFWHVFYSSACAHCRYFLVVDWWLFLELIFFAKGLLTRTWPAEEEEVRLPRLQHSTSFSWFLVLLSVSIICLFYLFFKGELGSLWRVLLDGRRRRNCKLMSQYHLLLKKSGQNESFFEMSCLFWKRTAQKCFKTIMIN
jgi:hypothetical protein